MFLRFEYFNIGSYNGLYDKPLSEPVMFRLPTHLYVTRPQLGKPDLNIVAVIVICPLNSVTEQCIRYPELWAAERVGRVHIGSHKRVNLSWNSSQCNSKTQPCGWTTTEDPRGTAHKGIWTIFMNLNDIYFRKITKFWFGFYTGAEGLESPPALAEQWTIKTLDS